ncbi:CLUMA_CG001460, isoform A [Clunio marinus]|uniref:CLUMA_CG001460, isoform A n=1 Tax=Clunio marinus TaxID=568069 RepID=A0A1J1HID7_9DIPT|nr:CLUMA_CG001460, isoform A [Clunio marinus]
MAPVSQLEIISNEESHELACNVAISMNNINNNKHMQENLEVVGVLVERFSKLFALATLPENSPKSRN